MEKPSQSEDALFEAARQYPTAEARAAYLDAACAAQPELRRRVAALLAAEDKVGEFLDQPLAGAKIPPSTPSPADEPAKAAPPGATMKITLPGEETLGSMIGRYKILEKVGEGGFGAVYVAEQREPVKRRVALKIIKLGMDTRQVVARFEAERQALALMDHPNIAKVLDAGATDTGRPFFAMELVRGIKFTEYCDQNKLSTEQRLGLFTKICQAIQHAHQKGIIHRDIKPSNILVTLHDGEPVPKVIDFGIAKATQGELTDKTVYTQFQQFIGTPAYMSPEQAEMSGLDVDTRSDIYSLGVLLYELLTGRTPFDQKQLMDAGLDGMRRMIREEEPVRPSTRVGSLPGEERTTTASRRHTEPLKLVSLLRGDLDWIVMRCLEKDRTRRYDTANGLAMDIQRYLNNEPIVARPPSKFYQFRKLVRRNKLAFAAASALGTALLLGALISTWQAIRAGRAEAAARSGWEAATRARRQAEVMNRFLRSMLEQATPDESASEEMRKAMADVLKRSTPKLEHDPEIARQPEVEAELRLNFGNFYFKLGLLNEAEENLRRALTLRREVLGPNHTNTLVAQEKLAWLLVGGVRKFDEGESLSRETWLARKNVLGPDHPDTLDSMDTYGTALTNQRKLDEAEKIYRQCLKDRERILGSDHFDTLTTKGNLAGAIAEAGRWLEAEPMIREVNQKRKEKGLEDNSESFAGVCNLAMNLFLQGRLKEADEMLAEGRLRARRVLLPEHPWTLHLQHVSARVLAEMGRLDEAEDLARQTLEVRQRKMPRHEGTGRTMLILGRVLVEKNKLDEAEPLLRAALNLFQTDYARKPELRAMAANWLGAIHVARHAYQEAESLLIPNIEPLMSRVGGISLGEQRTAVTHIVNLYQSWDKTEKAITWQKKLDDIGKSTAQAKTL